MDAERIGEEGNKQPSASDSVEVLEGETNGNMDTREIESNVTIISTSTTVLLWNEKRKDEQWILNHKFRIELKRKIVKKLNRIFCYSEKLLRNT